MGTWLTGIWRATMNTASSCSVFVEFLSPIRHRKSQGHALGTSERLGNLIGCSLIITIPIIKLQLLFNKPIDRFDRSLISQSNVRNPSTTDSGQPEAFRRSVGLSLIATTCHCARASLRLIHRHARSRFCRCFMAESNVRGPRTTDLG